MIEDIHFHDFIEAITAALDVKDPYTCGHSIRVAEIACELARKLDSKDFDTVHFAAHLHDIGKIGVKDKILLKPGKLTSLEFREIQKHSIIGFEIISKVRNMEGIAILIKHHHERFDGKGYPGGLKGADIPEGSRIIAAADALDAMTSARPYRKPMSFEAAMLEINAHSGDQFDPDIVKTVNECEKILRELIIVAKPETKAHYIELDHEYVKHSVAEF